jgi:hypothetical protein
MQVLSLIGIDDVVQHQALLLFRRRPAVFDDPSDRVLILMIALHLAADCAAGYRATDRRDGAPATATELTADDAAGDGADDGARHLVLVLRLAPSTTVWSVQICFGPGIFCTLMTRANSTGAPAASSATGPEPSATGAATGSAGGGGFAGAVDPASNSATDAFCCPSGGCVAEAGGGGTGCGEACASAAFDDAAFDGGALAD